MSSAPDPHGPDAHAFTGEPVQVLPPDEPRTPGWLPILGVALFTGAAVMFLAGRDAAPVPSRGGAEPAAAATAAAVVARPLHPQPPAAAPTPALRNPTPEQRLELRKALGDQKPTPAAAPRH